MPQNKMEEREDSDIGNYGNGFINVYLPREDGLEHKELVAPSPIFTVGSIYKFSDQVLNDRHLFLGKKTLHHTHFDRGDDIDSVGDDRDGGPRTIKLSLDASQHNVHISTRRRFNERLSAYVSNNRKTNDSIRLKTYSKSATTPRATRESTPRSVRDTVSRASTRGEHIKNRYQSPVLQLGTPRRGQSVEKALNSNTIGLPPLNSQRTMTRGKTYFVKDDTLWFPDSALKGVQQNNVPLRPSSREYKVWRQSSEMLVNDQLNRFSTPKLAWSQQRDMPFVQKTFV